MKQIICTTEKDTQNFAQKLVRSIKGGEIIALEGDLGSGKTTFVQGLASGLGIEEQITSPTFVLIKKHRIKIQVSGFKFQDFYHIDCYRLQKAWQLQELGFEEIISDPKNIVVIEWAEKIDEILPEDRIVIRFEFIGGERRKMIFLNKKE